MSPSPDVIFEAAAVPPDECGDSMSDSALQLAPLMPLTLFAPLLLGIVLQLFGLSCYFSCDEADVMEQASARHCCMVPQVATLATQVGLSHSATQMLQAKNPKPQVTASGSENHKHTISDHKKPRSNNSGRENGRFQSVLVDFGPSTVSVEGALCGPSPHGTTHVWWERTAHDTKKNCLRGTLQNPLCFAATPCHANEVIKASENRSPTQASHAASSGNTGALACTCLFAERHACTHQTSVRPQQTALLATIS